MPEIRAAEIHEPARTRTIAIFSGATSSVADHLQPVIGRTAAAYNQASNLIAYFLTPAAVLALSFGLWRLSADLGWTDNFPIEKGLFSHWMVWIAAAIGLKSTGSLLNRPDDPRQVHSARMSSK